MTPNFLKRSHAITCRRALRFFHIFYDQFSKDIAVRCFQHTRTNPFHIPQITNHSFPFYFCTFLQIFFHEKETRKGIATYTNFSSSYFRFFTHIICFLRKTMLTQIEHLDGNSCSSFND